MARTPPRQLRLVKTADVYKAGVPAGVLHRLPDRTEFHYLAEYLDSGKPLVAWSLPVRVEAFTAPAAAVPAFFAGLLPEGRRLTALRRTVGTSADDEFSMLLAVGSNTIGDVQFSQLAIQSPKLSQSLLMISVRSSSPTCSLRRSDSNRIASRCQACRTRSPARC